MLLSLGGRAVREEKYLQNLSFFTERLPGRGQPFFSRLGRCPRKRNRRGMFSIFSPGKSLSQPTFRGDVAATDLRKTGP